MLVLSTVTLSELVVQLGPTGQKYRLDPRDHSLTITPHAQRPPQSTPVQEGTLRKAGSRLGGDRQGCLEHKAQHFYKEKVKKVTWLRHGQAFQGQGAAGVSRPGRQLGPQVAVGRGRRRHGREVELGAN